MSQNSDVVVYVADYCPYCHAAKRLLQQKGVHFREISVEDRPDLREFLISTAKQHTIPQIFVNSRPIGGYSDMAELERGGRLDALLAENPPVDMVPLPS